MITAGEVLKRKRESLSKNLNTVSIDTKIQKRYLEYIEDNQFDKFDSEIFASGFLKIYAKYLELDVEKVLALYRRSNLPNTKIVPTKGTKVKRKGVKVSPKTIGVFTLVLLLLSVIGYVGYQIYKFQKPPVLIVTEPLDEYVSTQEVINIKGSTQDSALVEINNSQIAVDDNGEFQTEFTLKTGVNSISIKAWKDSNTKLNTTVTLKVVYTPPDEVVEIIEEKEFLLTLTISQSPSWIKLDIDNESILSQVLQPNTSHEYKVLKGFTLVTGRVQNTTLQINGEELNISSTNTTGIGQIVCEVVENELKCE